MKKYRSILIVWTLLIFGWIAWYLFDKDYAFLKSKDSIDVNISQLPIEFLVEFKHKTQYLNNRISSLWVMYFPDGHPPTKEELHDAISNLKVYISLYEQYSKDIDQLANKYHIDTFSWPTCSFAQWNWELTYSISKETMKRTQYMWLYEFFLDNYDTLMWDRKVFTNTEDIYGTGEKYQTVISYDKNTQENYKTTTKGLRRSLLLQEEAKNALDYYSKKCNFDFYKHPDKNHF